MDGKSVRSTVVGRCIRAGWFGSPLPRAGVSLAFFAVVSVGLLVCVGRAEAQQCIVATPIGSGDDRGIAVAIQSDGKIVVAGQSRSGAEFPPED